MTREEKINLLVTCWTDAMELDALIAFFEEKQREYLESQPDAVIDEHYKQDIEG